MNQLSLDRWEGTVQMPLEGNGGNFCNVTVGDLGEFVKSTCDHGHYRETPCRHYFAHRLRFNDERLRILNEIVWNRHPGGTETYDAAEELFATYRSFELRMLKDYALIVAMEQGNVAADDLHALLPQIEEWRGNYGRETNLSILGPVFVILLQSKLITYFYKFNDGFREQYRRPHRSNPSHGRLINVYQLTKKGELAVDYMIGRATSKGMNDFFQGKY